VTYDFTHSPDRSRTHSLKWENVHQDPTKEAVLPFWVADMDFAVLPAVQQALADRIANPVYGYTNLPAAYFQAVAKWHLDRSKRVVPLDWFLLTPSVLHAMSLSIRSLTKPGDGLLNMPPIYYPFYKMVDLHERRGWEVPLRRVGGRWSMDLDGLEKALSTAETEGAPIKALLFSSPHNPTGRVWTLDELQSLAQVVLRHEALIFADEIHADLNSPEFRHVSLVDLPELADRVLVFGGPNKTFNLAGLPISHVIVPSPTLRRRLKRALEGDFFEQPNLLAMTAALAAYSQGGSWLDELKGVIARNSSVLGEFLARWSQRWGLFPSVAAVPLEATYLAWVDLTPLINRFGFSDDRDLAQYLEEVGRVKFTAGSIFHTGGENHLRFNLATSETLLRQGLNRVEKALNGRLP